MSRFIQLHLLTSYPPSNLNRDDLGRPKTAVMGGKTRLRISSQSLKRAWRMSDVFEKALGDHIGTRTKRMGLKIYNSLLEKGVSERNAMDWAKKIANVFGKLGEHTKKEKEDIATLPEDKRKKKELEELEIKQLAHFSPEEENAINALIGKLVRGSNGPDEDDLTLLTKKQSAVDISMFGRMLADSPVYNIEAAVQVAHAITVHEVAVEDDYFTAVDDLNEGEEDMGAGHIGETEFAAGVYYLYVCINKELLMENLNGNKELTDKAVAALVEAAAKVAPTGKQNSFASRAYASYIMVEKGNQQPRSLSVAYLKPVRGDNGSGVMAVAIREMEENRSRMEKVYGPCADDCKSMNAEAGKGNLEEIINFTKE
ncbi:MAG: type I-E CRISPR-associated protein Cas7/Cse4/CasC [Deltaproteobacteria bacterium]|nr:type I-E CRISPR-associated protein Cas7/Cse4/CasC [Deltaproteobacteria bacterium]